MVSCQACARKNPPTRVNCVYCGGPLEVTQESAAWQRPTLRRLEKWEEGFNVILLPQQNFNLTFESLTQMSVLLKLSPEEIQRIHASQMPLPLARAASLDEALLVERRLSELGVQAQTVSDRDLGFDALRAKRLRALEFHDDVLIAYQVVTNEAVMLRWAEILLFVEGRRIEQRVEVEERRRRGLEKEIVDASETLTDEILLDIYTSQMDGGYRIASDGFDFSCLRELKSLVVAQNFSTLTGILGARASHAIYDDNYKRVRHALALVWPLEQQTESGGWRRARPGRVSTQAVTVSSNETQFTLYSRLQWFFRIHRAGLQG